MSAQKHHVRNPIRRHGDSPSRDFTIIPNELARDTQLGMHAYRAAIVIRTHSDTFEISCNSLAKSQGWGRGTTSKALQELSTAGWLAIQPHLTAAGNRAFETYHVHVARKFRPEELAELSEAIVLGPRTDQNNTMAPTDPSPWSDSDQPLALVEITKEDHLEDQQEEKEENHTAPRVRSDCRACRDWGVGCPIHGPEVPLARFGTDEPDWPDLTYPRAPEEEPPF